MTDVRRRAGAMVGAMAFAALAACGASGTPGTDNPTEPSSSESTPTTPTTTAAATAAAVRPTLGAIEPCGLLEGGDVVALFAVGPHTCEGQLDDVRVRVEVGVPFDVATLADADRGEISGLVAYTVAGGCSIVFPAGPGHGIAVSIDERCQNWRRAAEPVGGALADRAPDAQGPTPGPDAHTACGLLSAATADPALLVDAAGDQLQGLDHCEVDSGPVLTRTGLSISYRTTQFEKLARLLEGELVEIAGQNAVAVEGEAGCYVHTYLWGTEAEGRGSVNAEGVVRAANCDEARDVAAVVIEAVATEPAAPGSLADLLAGRK